MSRAAALPEDTGGEWQKVEWSGDLMPGGPYGFAIHIERQTADGLVEISKPYVLSDTDIKLSESNAAQVAASVDSKGTHIVCDPAVGKALHANKLIYHLDFNSLQRTREAVVRELEHVASVGYNAIL